MISELYEYVKVRNLTLRNDNDLICLITNCFDMYSREIYAIVTRFISATKRFISTN